LKDFRESTQLGSDSTWDHKTQASLFGTRESSLSESVEPTISPVASAVSGQAFFGGWTDKQGECGESPDPFPMTISAAGASSF
jgi:hypothetical protein